MSRLTVSYRKRKSRIIGEIGRPMIDLEMFSTIKKEWVLVTDVLVDTGADFSVIPYYYGALIVKDIIAGEKTEVSGVVPYAKLGVYLHQIKVRINGDEFEAPVLIAESDDVPPILGRVKAIDRFLAEFDKGKELRLS